MANDSSFTLSLLCYRWLSFHSHESSLHRVFTFYFRWLFAFAFSLGCVYLCSHLLCTFDRWVPILDFYLQGFSSFIPRNLNTWVKKCSFKVQKKLQMRTKEQGRRNTQKGRTSSKWSLKLAVWTEVTVFHLFSKHQQKHVRFVSFLSQLNHWLHQLLPVTHQP